MKSKVFIIVAMASIFVFGSVLSCFAGEATSSNAAVHDLKESKSNSSNSSAGQESPNITNEAEYAEWVRKRERTSQASSSSSIRSNIGLSYSSKSEAK